MSKKFLTITGLGLIGLSSTLLATPANAALSDCGRAPSGGQMTAGTDSVGDWCQLTFADAGTYEWTPAGITELKAILVGGGAGSLIENGNGYTGSGGSVRYVDVADSAASNGIDITVGSPGANSATNPTNGGNTVINDGVAHTADGGAAGSLGSGYCALDGNMSTYVGFGIGSKSASTTTNGETCALTGPGRNPSVDDDNYGNEASTIIRIDQEFGKGGDLVFGTAALPAPSVGQGANVKMNLTDNTYSSSTSAGSGYVAFRWRPSGDSTPEVTGPLASTGGTQSLLSGASLIAMGAGMALLVAAKRRKANN